MSLINVRGEKEQELYKVIGEGEKEQEVYKVIGETQLAALWAFTGRKLVSKYSDGCKFCIKPSIADCRCVRLVAWSKLYVPSEIK